MLTVSNDKTIRTWNGTAEGAALPLDGRTRRLFQAIFSPDSREDRCRRRHQPAGSFGKRQPGGGVGCRRRRTAAGARRRSIDRRDRVRAGQQADRDLKNDRLRALDLGKGTSSEIAGDYGQILAVSADRKRLFLGGHSGPVACLGHRVGTREISREGLERLRGRLFARRRVDRHGLGAKQTSSMRGSRKARAQFRHRPGDRERRVCAERVRSIATGSKDGTIRIWDAKTYEPEREGLEGAGCDLDLVRGVLSGRQSHHHHQRHPGADLGRRASRGGRRA